MDATLSRTDRKLKRRSELTHFLRTRRAGLSPADVGLAARGQRARAGLRREEVAVLAGVSASWYAWLEQGRPIRVSDGVLDAVSRALRLTERERVHLYRLAEANPPLPASSAETPTADVYQRVVDAQLLGPSCVIDRHWEILAANQLAADVLGLVGGANHNFLTSLFTGTHGEKYRDLPRVTREMTARFRLQASYAADDPRYERIADQLVQCDQRFAALWNRHEVAEFEPTPVEVTHPDGGVRSYVLFTMDLDEAASNRLLVYLPPEAAPLAA
ncbi:helix-turn-helix transcriptional regulator [Streptomyces sp. PT12]|uniref:helix-turn-helix transcriptional regulator n=1 Tax=Streptomyces sp. PT12 TaxID=1510197 RepID=UPI000DE3712F|nr:helix-turn-helix transcriptional regulator [Streptomyces sp. PT12]RBM14129.1 DNA-binding protein [Streptomyces sp. PT12]